MTDEVTTFVFIAIFLILFVLGIIRYSKGNKSIDEITFFVISYGFFLLLLEVIVGSLVVEFLGI